MHKYLVVISGNLALTMQEIRWLNFLFHEKYAYCKSSFITRTRNLWCEKYNYSMHIYEHIKMGDFNGRKYVWGDTLVWVRRFI